MRIKWYGHAAFRIVPEQGPTVITDPYTPDLVGYPTIGDPADLVLTSSSDDLGHCRSDLISGNPLVVNTLDVAQSGGKIQAKGVVIRAIETIEWEDHPDRIEPYLNAMYRWRMDNILLAHMGDVGNPLTKEQQDFLATVDVLFALAGGPPTIALPDLMDVITQMKPKLVIPMHFRTKTYKHQDILPIEDFLSYFNANDVTHAPSDEIEMFYSEIPSSTQVMVMDHAYPNL